MAKKGLSTVQKILVFFVLIILSQIGYLVYKMANNEGASDFDKVIASKVSHIADPRERSLAAIQFALTKFNFDNRKYPDSLTELSPLYLKEIPKDPNTGRTFSYTKVGVTYRLGDEGVALAKKLEKKALDAKTGKINEEVVADSLLGAVEQTSWLYDPTGKRDPFEPFNLNPDTEIDESAPPLCRLALSQLKMTAVLEGFTPTRAMLEDTSGKGYTVQPGTRLGLSCGEIVAIEKERILIIEEKKDFTGKITKTTAELKLKTAAEKS